MTDRLPTDRKYAPKARLAMYVHAARELGIEVGGFEITPDGTIRVMSIAAMQPVDMSREAKAARAYDEWKAKDQLRPRSLAAAAV